MRRLALSSVLFLSFATPAFAAGALDGSCPSDQSLDAVASLLKPLAEIRDLLKDHTDRHEEARIIDIFKNANKADLNGLIGSMSQEQLEEMISDINDRLIGPDNRTAFFDLLAHKRLGDLSIASRAKLISALQEGATDGLKERTIRDILLGTHGADLTALKKLIDHGEDHRDLQQLVFHDIDDSKIRREILAHFAKEGAAKNGEVKVFSDIDDTFYENLKDPRYPRKTVYPGVVEFYDALDKGRTGSEAGGDLMFLSARPYDRGGASEHLTRDTLEAAGVKDPTVLSGDLLHVIGNHAIADKKFENWSEIRQLYPEYGSVFVGDSGQGDAIFGARAAATTGGDMKHVFIHNVTDVSAAERADFASHGVHIFDMYVGAATDAYKSGLISKDSLLNVAAGAQRELAAVPFTDAGQKAAREADLARDLAAMNAALN